jgi:uncharacterized protein (DUF433 family)
MNWRDYIEENPKILGGKPVFKGTRLSVEFLFERLTTGDSPQYLLEQLPTLKPEHLRAAYAFAALQLSLTRSVLADEEAVRGSLPMKTSTAVSFIGCDPPAMMSSGS